MESWLTELEQHLEAALDLVRAMKENDEHADGALDGGPVRG